MKALGYTIRFYHVNPDTKKYNEIKERVKEFTGEDIQIGTVCVITEGEGESPVAIGFAKLWHKDHFIKAKGRAVSLTYAIRLFPRNERKIIWDEVAKYCALP
jgi:hypothetical protein